MRLFGQLLTFFNHVCSERDTSTREREIGAGDDGSNGVARPSVSPVRRATSQYCAIMSTSVLMICYGMSIGYSTMLIADLSKENPDIVVTREQLTWISSTNYFIIPLGAVLSGPLSQLMGRRNSLMLITLPYMLAWLLLYSCSGSTWQLFSGLILLGLVNGLIESPSQVYVTEISEPHLRGSISGIVSAAISLGIFIQTLLGSYMHWTKLALVNGAFPFVALVTMAFVPESPYWLASKGRVNEARRSLCWLRGWSTPSQVRPEFDALLESDSKSGKTPVSDNRSFFELYCRRVVWVPFAVVSFAMFISCINGSVSVLSWAVTVFKDLKPATVNSTSGSHVSLLMDEYTCTIILTSLQLVAALLFVVLIPLVGKRMPTFVSLVVSGLGLLVVSAYAYLRDVRNVEVSGYEWLPIVSIIVSLFASQLGIRSTPWVLAGEVFPIEVRGVLAGVVGSTCNLYAALAAKTYIYTLDWLSMWGTYLFFAVMNFVGLAVLYRTMPDTDGKTLQEIEQHYARGTKLTSNKNHA